MTLKQNENVVLQGEADQVTVLKAISTLLGDDTTTNKIPLINPFDLDKLMDQVGWQSSFAQILKLLTQGIPAPVVTSVILNVLPSYNLRQEEWVLLIQVTPSHILVRHSQVQASSIANDPDSATPQKNFTFRWNLNITLPLDAQSIVGCEVDFPIDDVIFEEKQNLNPAWRLKVLNLVDMLRQQCNTVA